MYVLLFMFILNVFSDFFYIVPCADQWFIEYHVNRFLHHNGPLFMHFQCFTYLRISYEYSFINLLIKRTKSGSSIVASKTFASEGMEIRDVLSLYIDFS